MRPYQPGSTFTIIYMYMYMHILHVNLYGEAFFLLYNKLFTFTAHTVLIEAL